MGLYKYFPNEWNKTDVCLFVSSSTDSVSGQLLDVYVTTVKAACRNISSVLSLLEEMSGTLKPSLYTEPIFWKVPGEEQPA